MSSDERPSRSRERFLDFVVKWVVQFIRWCFSRNPAARLVSQTRSAIVELPDGAKLAYDILGSQHLGKTTPVVMICGMTALKSDNERVNEAVAQSHPGNYILCALTTYVPICSRTFIFSCFQVLVYDHRCAIR